MTLLSLDKHGVNKGGGPDRRFNGNRQLPICQYGEMEFRSASGLNCVIQYSNADAGHRFSQAMKILHRPESKIQSKAITSAEKPKQWPCVLAAFLFLFCGIVLLLSTNNGITPPVRAAIGTNDISLAPAKSTLKPAQEMQNPSDTRKALNPVSNVPKPRVQQEPQVGVSAPASPPSASSGSIQQCLLIPDVDDRVECLEQFRM